MIDWQIDKRHVAPFGVLLFTFALGAALFACKDDPLTKVVVKPESGLVAPDGGHSGDGAMGDGDGPGKPGGPDKPAVCGNAMVEGGEECDDGAQESGDGCDEACQLESCGDGKRDRFEGCDDGNRRSGDGCDRHCQDEMPPPACGNGQIDDDDEECDDGNLMPGDGCDEACRGESCGDGRVAPSETCDPPADGVCTADCQWVLPNCGDGVVQSDEREECDDGNDRAGDGCHRCRLECGDNVVNPLFGEQCEPPGTTSGRPCDEACHWVPVCGDGIFQPEKEGCDGSSAWPVPYGYTCERCKLVAVAEGGDGDSGDVGDGDGAPAVPCVASHASIVPDGSFDEGVDAWTPSVRARVSHDTTDGALELGALRMDFGMAPNAMPDDKGLELALVSRCLLVTPGHNYRFRAMAHAATAVDMVASVRVTGYDTYSCSGTAQPNLAGLSAVRPTRSGWMPVDTMVAVTETTRTVNLELLMIKPRGVGAAMLWDDIRMVSMDTDPACGNCVLDEQAGESCDDGNRLARDGCSSTCQREGCGDGFASGDEECDDGALLWSDSDTCTPSCQLKACDGRVGCSAACNACISSQCTDQLAASLDLAGRAEAGPRAGTLRSVLAEELRDCAHRTGCAGPTLVAERSLYSPAGGALENCYCGTAFDTACYVQGAANGLCRAEVEAVVETTRAEEVWSRMGSSTHPVAGAVAQLLWCEGNTADGGTGVGVSCGTECAVTSSCGDGVVQDRPAAEAHALCRSSGAAGDCRLYFEECDDGGTEGGDGCDDHCFVEVCGNGIVQAGEECDDGNVVSGDGCNPKCEREFHCGDGMVTEGFEECDLPGDDNPDTVCTLDEYQDDPSLCHCDRNSCQRVVCGDNVRGEGEQCEPPGEGSCDATCMVAEHPCIACSRLITPDPAVGRRCAPGLYLQGLAPPNAPPGYMVPEYLRKGCQSDDNCFGLVECVARTGCSKLPNGFSTCLCGDTPYDACAALAVGPGECFLETARAFEAQYGGPPKNVDEVITNLGNNDLVPRPLSVAYEFLLNCLGDSNALVGPYVRDSLCPDPTGECPASSIEQANACELACTSGN